MSAPTKCCYHFVPRPHRTCPFDTLSLVPPAVTMQMYLAAANCEFRVEWRPERAAEKSSEFKPQCTFWNVWCLEGLFSKKKKRPWTILFPPQYRCFWITRYIFWWVLCYRKISLDAGTVNSVIIMKKQVVTHPGSSCWFQMGRYFLASPPWGRWWFLCFGPGILSLRVGLRPHPVSASFHCHGDQGRPRAIRRCPDDIWGGLDCSPHRRCCRRRREDPAKSSHSIRQWRVRVSLPALPTKMHEIQWRLPPSLLSIMFANEFVMLT